MFCEHSAGCYKSLFRIWQFAEFWNRELFLNIFCLYRSDEIVDLFSFLTTDSQDSEHSSQELKGLQGMKGVSITYSKQKGFKNF